MSTELGLALAAALLAGTVRGFAGFGAAMILVPVLAATFGPTLAVPILQLTDLILTSPLAWRARRRCTWAEVVPLTLGYALTLPLGLAVLLRADPELLTRAMGLLVLAVALLMASGWRRRTQPGRTGTLAVGGAAGFLSGATGIGGPPVVLFWLAGADGASRVRANIIVFFSIGGVLSLTALGWAGLLTLEVARLTLILLPAYGLGLILGSRAFAGSDDARYRRIALAIIASIGALSLV